MLNGQLSLLFVQMAVSKPEYTCFQGRKATHDLYHACVFPFGDGQIGEKLCLQFVKTELSAEQRLASAVPVSDFDQFLLKDGDKFTEDIDRDDGAEPI